MEPSADAASVDLLAKVDEPPAPAAKADAPRRLAAAAIDGLLALALYRVPYVGPPLAALYLLLRDGVELPVVERRSVGKKLVGLRVIRQDGRETDVSSAVVRNLTIAVAPVLPLVPVVGWIAPYVWFLVAVVEVVMYFSDGEGQRLGDRMAGTHVIVDPAAADPGTGPPPPPAGP
jgi:uncharacterized RDD family membrane protein YckC